MKCPECGANTVSAARFCATCGKPLPVRAETKMKPAPDASKFAPPVAWGRRTISLCLWAIALVMAVLAFSDYNFLEVRSRLFQAAAALAILGFVVWK